MSREIKFRAIQNHTGEWIYGNLLIDSRGERFIIPNTWVEQCGHHLRIVSDIPVFIKEGTEGQHTGLKDKAGTPIYEGDIVNITDLTTRKAPFICKVYFDENIAGFSGKGKYLYDLFLHNPSKMLPERTIEIIGNIHQNPELLEVQP